MINNKSVQKAVSNLKSKSLQELDSFLSIQKDLALTSQVFQDIFHLINTEKECVRRNIHSEYDKHCENCDLSLSDEFVLSTYDAITELLLVFNHGVEIAHLKSRSIENPSMDELIRQIGNNDGEYQ